LDEILDLVPDYKNHNSATSWKNDKQYFSEDSNPPVICRAMKIQLMVYWIIWATSSQLSKT